MELNQIARVNAVAYFARIERGRNFRHWVVTVPGTGGCLHKVNVYVQIVPSEIMTTCSCRAKGHCYHQQGAILAVMGQWFKSVRFIKLAHRRAKNLGTVYTWTGADKTCYGHVQVRGNYVEQVAA